MALKGIWIVDRTVQEQLGGCVNLKNDTWIIPPPTDPAKPSTEVPSEE
jgi:hypothetical protein